MKLTISYNELSELTVAKSGKKISFAPGNEPDEFVVNYTQHIPILGDKVFSIPVALIAYKDKDVNFEVRGDKNLMPIVNMLVPMIATQLGVNCIENYGNVGMMVHLADIPQLQPLWEKVDVRTMHFTEEGCVMAVYPVL